MKKLKNNSVYSSNGFTLAEVLIALGIIGVIAAITLVNLINTINDAQYKETWKKQYAVIEQAYMQVLKDKGGNLTNVYTTDTGSESFKNDIKAKMSYIKDCSGAAGYGGSGSGSDDGGCWHASSKWYSLDGAAYSDNALQAHGGFVLKDGSFLLFSIVAGDCTQSTGSYYRCGLIYIDLNGFKKPNTIGKDIYAVSCLSNKILPYGVQGKEDYATTCPSTVTAGTTGFGCSAKYLLGY